MPCSFSLCRCDHLPSFLQSCIALDITLDYNTATENAKQLRKVSYCIIAQDFTDFWPFEPATIINALSSLPFV